MRILTPVKNMKITMKLMKQKILVQLKLYPHMKSSHEVKIGLWIVQNWGQIDGMPDCPQGMDTLVKLENILMLRKFQKGSVQKRMTDYCQ